MRSMKIHVILLSGGSGKRLWPLSNEIRSKQFLSVLPDGSGGTESMLQRVFRQLQAEFAEAHIVVATGEAQSEQIRSQVGPAVDIVSEPARRDTFPAIALSTTFLHDVCKASDEDVVAVLPIDAFAEQHYYATVRRMCSVVDSGAADLVLMGIAPASPSSRFGYMVRGAVHDGYAEIERFVEKPSEEEARKLIDAGALWNGGVFAFRLGYLMQIVRSHLGTRGFAQMLCDYPSLQKISFDYAVVEQAESIAMVPYDGPWKDLGTWDALAQEVSPAGVGRHMSVDSEGTLVINELNVPVVALGVDNLIIVANPDGVLVTAPEASNRLKPIADQIQEPPRFEQCRWGSRTVLERTCTAHSVQHQTSRIDLVPDSQVSFSYGNEYAVYLICTEGEGHVGIDGTTRMMHRGDHIKVEGKKLVTIQSKPGMQLVETQLEITRIFP